MTFFLFFLYALICMSTWTKIYMYIKISAYSNRIDLYILAY